MALFQIFTVYSAAVTFIAGLVLTIFGYFLLNEFNRYQARIKGLSGPVGLPVIGNLHQVRSWPCLLSFISLIILDFRKTSIRTVPNMVQ